MALEPGASETVTFEVSARALARADSYDGALVSAPGAYRLVFTGGDGDGAATVALPLTVTGAEPAVIEAFPEE